MRTFSRTRTFRWLVPVLTAVLLLGGGWATSRLTASAQETLQPRTPEQLLTDVQRAHLDGLSGTVVQKSDLGIPALPGGSGGTDLSSLVSGTHTMRVWLSAPDKARVAVMGTLGESDWVTNGKDLWAWSSRDKTATHHTLSTPKGAQSAPGAPGASPSESGAGPATPQQAARELLSRIDSSTKVLSDGTTTVADRPAYLLTLTPRDSRSLVGQVRIAIDGATHVPLRVQVVPRGTDAAAFEVGYTSFDPTRPAASTFDFTPPPGAKVTQGGQLGPSTHAPSAPQQRSAPGKPSAPDHNGPPPGKVVGKGWTAVLVAKAPTGALSGGSASSDQAGQLGGVLRALPRVSGSWGSGRLLSGPLFSAVLTDDGRLAVGAVRPALLYQALATR